MARSANTSHGEICAPGLAPPPPTQDWGSKVGAGWGMMGNDKVGDCTCAAAGHLVMDWTANTGKEVVPSSQQIVAAYSAITGYNPVIRATASAKRLVFERSP